MKRRPQAQIPEKSWSKYIQRLAQINEKAASLMQAFVDMAGLGSKTDLIDYCYAVATKYGEASSALACEMYDAISDLEKATVPAAEPAATATYAETAKAVNGALKQSPSGATLSGTAYKLTKQAGADTILKNAQRDGAYWAWVPSGDSCSFCLMLASRGWQRASKKTMAGAHASHIHANCKCSFAVSFSAEGNLPSFNPDRYLDMYEGAEGKRWQDKLNAMRREQYPDVKDHINAQKRAAYRKRKEFEETAGE